MGKRHAGSLVPGKKCQEYCNTYTDCENQPFCCFAFAHVMQDKPTSGIFMKTYKQGDGCRASRNTDASFYGKFTTGKQGYEDFRDIFLLFNSTLLIIEELIATG